MSTHATLTGATLADAKAIASNLGFKFAKEDGEYQITPKPDLMAGTKNAGKSPETFTYYTTDLDDAVATMVKEHCQWIRAKGS